MRDLQTVKKTPSQFQFTTLELWCFLNKSGMAVSLEFLQLVWEAINGSVKFVKRAVSSQN